MRKIIIGLSPLLLAIPSVSFAASPQWQVSEASGEVRLTQNGQSRAAVRGALLASGATITTGAKARAVIVRGEEFVVISPGTQLRVPAADTPNTVMQMIEDFGTAVFKIKKKSTPHFGVQTPYLAAVVKGTTFTVTIGPEGGSVQVTEGAVEVSTLDGGAANLVEPGGIASVGASDLYQLTVDGDASKIIRSENAPSPNGVVTSSTALPAQGAPATSAASAFTGPMTQSMMIGAAIAENPQSLGAVTDGLVEGDVAIELAAVAVQDVRTPDARLGPKDSDPKDSDKPGSSDAAQGAGDQAPGKSGDAPGQVKDTGKSGEAPGQVAEGPGKSGDAPGQIDDTPGKSGEAPANSGSGSDNSGSGNSGSGNSGSGNSGSGSGDSASGNSGSGSSGSGDPSVDAAAEKAAKEAEKATQKAAEEAAKAAEEAQKAADKAVEEADKAAQKAAEEAAKAADEAQKAADKAVEEAQKAAEKAAEDAAKAADEAAKAAEKAAKEAAEADDGLCVAGAVCVDIL